MVRLQWSIGTFYIAVCIPLLLTWSVYESTQKVSPYPRFEVMEKVMSEISRRNLSRRVSDLGESCLWQVLQDFLINE